MLIDLRFAIPCTPDAAWEAVHRPAVAADLYGPLLQLRPCGEFPARFTDGDAVEVEMRVWGRIPVGRQVIRVRDEVHLGYGGSDGEVDAHGSHRSDGAPAVRTMHDEGHPVAGPLALVNGWHHRMTITAHPSRPGTAVWRDRLEFHGAWAPLVWPVLRATWAWRGWRIRAAAASWG